MASLDINWTDLETAFERNSPEMSSFLDLQTGAVLMLVDGNPEDDRQKNLAQSRPDLFLLIDPASSREQYRWMERFVASVEDAQLRERLLVAIDGKGAFRRFKDVLLSFPQDRERWFNYRAALLHHHITQWFEAKGLEPDPPCPWDDVELPPEPEPLPEKTGSAGQGVTDQLRHQIKQLLDLLPACELHSARVFLEYLRDRGSAALLDDGAEDEVFEPDAEEGGSRTPLKVVGPGGD